MSDEAATNDHALIIVERIETSARHLKFNIDTEQLSQQNQIPSQRKRNPSRSSSLISSNLYTVPHHHQTHRRVAAFTRSLNCGEISQRPNLPPTHAPLGNCPSVIIGENLTELLESPEYSTENRLMIFDLHKQDQRSFIESFCKNRPSDDRPPCSSAPDFIIHHVASDDRVLTTSDDRRRMI